MIPGIQRHEPPSGDYDWMAGAPCKTLGPDTFVPQRPHNRNGPVAVRDYNAKVAAAKAVCAGCDVRAICLAYALELGPTLAQGVWGGTTDNERRNLRRSRWAS